MAIAADGSIFVAEAHNDQFLDADAPAASGASRSSRADGKFVKSFGRTGTGRASSAAPHSLAFDSKGRLFVADRGNRRIQIFDQDGKHLDTWYQFSRISGLTITADDTLYAIDSESDDNYNPGWRKGLRVGSARTGEVWYFVPEHVSKQASGMGGYGSMGEGVTVDARRQRLRRRGRADPGADQVRSAAEAVDRLSVAPMAEVRALRGVRAPAPGRAGAGRGLARGLAAGLPRRAPRDVPPLVVVGIDGFRPDYLDRADVPGTARPRRAGRTWRRVDSAVSQQDVPELHHHRHRAVAGAPRHRRQHDG